MSAPGVAQESVTLTEPEKSPGAGSAVGVATTSEAPNPAYTFTAIPTGANTPAKRRSTACCWS